MPAGAPYSGTLNTQSLANDNVYNEISTYITDLLQKLYLITTHPNTQQAVTNATNILSHNRPYSTNLVTTPHSIGYPMPFNSNSLSPYNPSNISGSNNSTLTNSTPTAYNAYCI